MEGQWIVDSVRRTNLKRAEAVNWYYPFTVSGRHADNGERFEWMVPELGDGYVFSPAGAADLLEVLS